MKNVFLNEIKSYPDEIRSYCNQSQILFEQAISILYSKLLESQEVLGTELQNIIHKNLWDLYES